MWSFLLGFVRGVAEGKFGDIPKAVYWRLAGWKSWTGLVLAVAYAGLSYASSNSLCDPCAGLASGVGWLSSFLLAAGLVDAGIRAEPPVRK